MPAPKGNKNAAGNPGGGRETKYKPEYAQIAQKHCELGATDADLAAAFGVSGRTIDQWKITHVEFSSALKAGKTPADDRVERSLFHRAVGYTFDSEKVFQFQGEIVRAKTKEHVPPDTTACIFWLKNRRTEQWRDIQRYEHGSPGEFAALEDEALMDELRNQALELGVEVEEGATAH